MTALREQPGVRGAAENPGCSPNAEMPPLVRLVLIVYGELKPRAEMGEGASPNLVSGLVDEIETVLRIKEDR